VSLYRSSGNGFSDEKSPDFRWGCSCVESAAALATLPRSRAHRGRRSSKHLWPSLEKILGQSYTPKQVAAACLASSRVYSGSMSRADAILHLSDDIGINSTSANDYIVAYRKLVTGESFLRGMSAEAMEHFLNRILEVHGSTGLANALRSLQLHIERMENGQTSTMQSMRTVLNHFRVRN